MDTVNFLKMSVKVITMFQKSGGFIHTQIALDFNLNLDVIAIKDAFQTKTSVRYQKSNDPRPPEFW